MRRVNNHRIIEEIKGIISKVFQRHYANMFVYVHIGIHFQKPTTYLMAKY